MPLAGIHLAHLQIIVKRIVRQQIHDLMSISTIILILLILLLVGALPTWPYSNSWGYYPSGGLGLVVLILVILLLLGRV